MIEYGWRMTAFVRLLAFLVGTAAAGMPTVFGGDWQQWRGPKNTGVAPDSRPPITWSETENIRWKVPVPGLGLGSPIVSGDAVFVVTAIPQSKPVPQEVHQRSLRSAADRQAAERDKERGYSFADVPHSFELLCFDRATGRLRWQRAATTAHPHEGHHRLGSFANASPITDGKRVYAFFGSRGLHCFDFDGEKKWSVDFGVALRVRLEYGEGSSPALAGDVLVVQCDHQGDSFAAAVDKRDGRILWRHERDEVTSWSSPIVVETAGGPQAILAATGSVRSYDLATGDLRWTCSGMTANCIPTPVVGNGMVYLTSGYRDQAIMAVDLKSVGDARKTGSVRWEADKGAPYVPSPLLYGNEFYLVDDRARMSCYDALTGAPHYVRKRIPKRVTIRASLVGANDLIYVTAETGQVFVVRRGPQFEVVAHNTLDDAVILASPAIAGDALFLRSERHLYCIGER